MNLPIEPNAAKLSDLIKYEDLKQQIQSNNDPSCLTDRIESSSNPAAMLVDSEGNPLHKAELQEDDEMYGIKEPLKSCKHCYGRGIEGWRTSGKPILCRCLKRTSNGDWITWKEFRALSNYVRC